MFQIPRTHEEVSKLHQKQPRGIVSIPQFQRDIKYGALLTLHAENACHDILEETPSQCTNMH